MMISLTRKSGLYLGKDKDLVHFEIIDGEHYGYLHLKEYRKFLWFYWYKSSYFRITASDLVKMKRYFDDLWAANKKN